MLCYKIAIDLKRECDRVRKCVNRGDVTEFGRFYFLRNTVQVVQLTPVGCGLYFTVITITLRGRYIINDGSVTERGLFKWRR